MSNTKAMKDSKALIDQSVQEIEASKKTSPTEAGRSNTASSNVELQDAINQVFALFRINFHNQYHAAFGDTQLVNQAKKLWLQSLGHFSAQQILQGARNVIEQSDYLPTLNRMITTCEEVSSEGGLPSVREAYLEACSAPSPKAAFNWSHPAVYHAGKEAGWFLLANEPETTSYPKFKECYRKLCRQIANGEEFLPPESLLEQQPAKVLNKSDQLEQLQNLREQLGL